MESEKQIVLDTSKWLIELLGKLSFPLAECPNAMNAKVMLTNIIVGIANEKKETP